MGGDNFVDSCIARGSALAEEEESGGGAGRGVLVNSTSVGIAGSWGGTVIVAAVVSAGRMNGEWS